MRARVRRPVEDAPEGCVAPGCSELAAPRLPCCSRHFAELPAHEQVGYFEAMDAALLAPDIQRAVRDARVRVGAVLRGVRA